MNIINKAEYKLPEKLLICCSGGVDSISAAHYLHFCRKHKITLYHFNHKTPQGDEMEQGVKRFADHFNFELIIHRTDKVLAKEAEFRAERIKFLENGNFDAVSAHHLGDAIESFIMNVIRGHQWKIPIKIKSKIGGSDVYHPFLLAKKQDFIRYSQRNSLDKFIVEDKSNSDPGAARRNWIRNILLPMFKEQGIGFEKIVRKQYLEFLSGSK